MIRSLRLIALSVALPLAGTGCWMEVPNLQSTGGGYPPDMMGSAGGAPAAEHSPSNTVPESEPDPGSTP